MWAKDAKQFRLAVGLLLTIALFLCSCADEPTAANSPQQASADSDGDKDKITIWELVLDDNPWASPMFAAAAAALNMEEEVEVVQRRIDGHVFDDQIEAADETKQLPNAATASGPFRIKIWSDAGLLFPVSSCLETYPEFQQIPETLWHEVTWNDNVWGFPVAIGHTEALFYNKRLLSELGWSSTQIEELPERIASGEFTLNDLLETATLATELGVVEPGFSLGGYAGDFLPMHLIFENRVVEGELQQTVSRQTLADFFRFRQELFTRNLVQQQFMQRTYNTWSTRLLFNDSVTHGRFLFWRGYTHLWKLWSNSFAAELGGEDYMLENFGVAMIPAINPNIPLITPGNGRYYAIFAPDGVEPENMDQICALFAKVAASEINQLHPPLSGQQSVLFDQAEKPLASPDPFTARTNHLLEFTQFWGLQSYYPTDLINQYTLRVDTGELTPQQAAEFAILEMQNVFGAQLIVK